MENKTCAKCGSNHLMPNLRTGAVNTDDFAVAVDIKWTGSSVGFSMITATVCADCGYTEFYAKHPKNVWEEWRKRNA